jgi:hypothetical protein
MTETLERRFALTRLGSGDYLLPSNDERGLYRIQAYDEDGSLSAPGGGAIRGRFWLIYVHAGEVDRDDLGRITGGPVDPDDPYEWIALEYGFPTRKAAIEHLEREIWPREEALGDRTATV